MLCLEQRAEPGLILGLRPANEKRRYFVTTSRKVTPSPLGWAQAYTQPWELLQMSTVYASSDILTSLAFITWNGLRELRRNINFH